MSVGGTATATITNAYTPTSLKLSKEVVVPEGEDVPADTFTVTLTPPDGHEAITDTYGDMHFDRNVATVTLRGGQSATATAIPAGTSYTITEAAHPGFGLTGITSDGSAVSEKQATGALTEEAGYNHAVEFGNARLGGLEVTKAVTGLPDALKASKTFRFTVSREVGGKLTYFLPDGLTTEDPANAAITIRNGQVASFEGLASGTYVVTELGTGESGSAQVDGHRLTASGSGNVAVSAGTMRRATLSNTYAKVGLTVSKEIVVTDGADHSADEFTFTVTLTPPEGTEAISGTYGDMTFKDNVATLTLKGGASATATCLPVGTKYVVTEAAHDGFTLTGIASDGKDTTKEGNASGTITAHENHSAAFTNATARGKLVVRKVVDGVGTDRKFSFAVYQANNGLYTYYKKDGASTTNKADATYSIGDGEAVTFEDLAPGIYAVEEFTDGAQIDGYHLVASGSGDVSVSNGQTTTATLTKSYVAENFGGLRVSKTVFVPDGLDRAQDEFTFHVTLVPPVGIAAVNGTYGEMVFEDNVATVRLKGGETAEATGIPAGTSFTVADVARKDYEISSITCDGKDVTKEAEATDTISATEADGHEVIFENAYSAKGVAEISVAKSIVPIGHVWADDESYTFTLSPVADEDGNMPPMPAGTDIETGSARATVTKADEDHTASFGTISLTEPGTYTYRVEEVWDDVEGIEYYDGEETVTIEVVDNGDGALVAADGSSLSPVVEIRNTAESGQLRLWKTVRGPKLTNDQLALITFEVKSADGTVIANPSLLDFEEAVLPLAQNENAFWLRS